MSGVAIIDHAGPDPGIAHDYAHTWWIRDRLDRAQGHHDNEVLWFGPAPLIGDPSWPTEALLAMDRWLAAVERDHVERAARAEDRRRQARRSPGPLHRRPVRAVPGHPLRNASQRGRRRRVQRHRQVPAEAAAPRGLQRRDVHGRAVGAAAEDLPQRRLRLEPAGGRPAAQPRLAHLPGLARAGDLRRTADGAGAAVECRCGEVGRSARAAAAVALATSAPARRRADERGEGRRRAAPRRQPRRADDRDAGVHGADARAGLPARRLRRPSRAAGGR